LAFSVAAWFTVLCDVISVVAEFMVIGLQCCGIVYGGTSKRVDNRDEGVILDRTAALMASRMQPGFTTQQHRESQ
jgi:hypothetical protein